MMPGRWLPYLAALAGATAVAVLVLTAIVGSVSAPHALIRGEHLLALAWVGLPAVGALVGVRRPGTRLAWLLVASGVAVGLGRLGNLLVAQSFVWEDSTAVAGYVGLYLRQLQYAGYPLLAAALLRFPTDQLPRRGGRLVERALIASVALTPWAVLAPELEVAGRDGGVANPLLVPVLSDVAAHTAWWVGLAGVVATVVAVGHLLVRGVRSRGVERQQMKWVALAVAGWVAVLAVIVAVQLALPAAGARTAATLDVAIRYAFPVATIVCFNGVAAAIGAAVMRYRLYEVDRLISRTLTYAVLTAVLAGVYGVGVLGVSRLLHVDVEGGGGDVLVAVSTLVVAGLFSPVRRRTGAIVDRRFNRDRYDAAQAVASFSHRLRDEVDVDAVTGQLQRAAAVTVQPATLTVWLNGATRHATGTTGGQGSHA